METPDSSLVRRNQIKQHREGKEVERGGGVETTDASLVRGNQKGKGGRKVQREVEQPDTSLVRLPNKVEVRVWNVITE